MICMYMTTNVITQLIKKYQHLSYLSVSLPYYDVTQRSRCSCPRTTDGESIRFNLARWTQPTRHVFTPSDYTCQPFSSPPRTTEPPNLHIVSRALRETTKSKLMHPNSPRPLDYPRSWVRVPVLSKQGSTMLTGFDYLLLPACG